MTEYMKDANDKLGWLMIYSQHDISGYWLIGATAEGEIIRWDGPHSKKIGAIKAFELLNKLNFSENQRVVKNIIIYIDIFKEII